MGFCSAVAVVLVSVALKAPVTAASAEPLVATVPVAIEWSWRVPASLPVQGDLVLTPLDAGSPVRLHVTSDEPVQVRLPPGSKWEASAAIPGFWVQRKALTVQQDQNRLALQLWPLGTVSGSLTVKDKGVPLPRSILIKTLSAPPLLKRPQFPPGALDCPVDEKGAWACQLVAASFDLVINAEGFIPVYRMGVEVPAGSSVRIGNVEIERGSSLAAWVAVDDGLIEAGRCTAHLSPRVSESADLGKSQDLARRALVREVRQDGFLQLTGLAPGVYSLEIRQPGYSPAKVDLVRVEPGSETFLREPLILHRPLDLEVEIVPPLDWLGRAWRSRVSRLDPGVRIAPVVFDGAADGEGKLVVPNQSKGTYRIAIMDSLGNRLHSSSDIHVDGQATAQQTIHIEVVDISGRVWLGDQSLAATLWFGGRSGSTSIKMEANPEGEFFGVLPREGRWNVEVEATEPRLESRIRVDVRTSDSGKASLEIKLPDTHVFGRVLTEAGEPVHQARVAVQGESLEHFTLSDPDGRFDLRGLPAGFAWLGAESSSRLSDRVGVTLSEDSEVGPIELRLRAMESLAGTVTSRRGPIAGAQVEVMVPAPEGWGSATTDPEGAFSVQIPQGARRAMAMVAAPGYALRTFDLALGGGPISLVLSEEGGTLEVAFSDASVAILQQGSLGFVVRQNGLPIPPLALQRWAQGQSPGDSTNGKTLRFPNVAPGEYRACLMPRQLPLLSSEAVLSAAGVRCDEGTLSSGGTLSLKPPP